MMKRKHTGFKNAEGYVGVVYWYRIRIFNKDFDFWHKVKMVKGLAVANPISQEEKDRINDTFDRREPKMNQSPGCESCYENTPLFQGERLHVNRMGRTLRIVDYPLDGNPSFVESFYLRLNSCPNCGHKYEVHTIQEGWKRCERMR